MLEIVQVEAVSPVPLDPAVNDHGNTKMRLLKLLLVYLIAGPAIGFAALFISMQLQADAFFSVLANDQFLVPLIYAFGLLPALGTGFIVYAVRKRFTFAILVMVSALVAAVLASLIWLVQPDWLTTAIQLGVLPGFFGGAGAALLARRSLVAVA